MPVTIKNKNDVITAIISGEVDHHSAPDIREIIDDAIIVNESAKRIVLDFSEVTFMDSSGVGLVMGRYRLAVSNKKSVSVVNLSPRDYKIFKMSGLEKIADISMKSNENTEVKYEKNK
jgi:stage II sporulation protein AA (anti-sigma F factor antagonist)